MGLTGKSHATASPHHRVTVSPCQSVICLAPCHQTNQSFALPPATKPVSHLTCPIPLCHCATASPCHRITASPHHCATTSLHHCITASLHHHITMPLHHCITMSVSNLPCPLPPNHSVICLAPCHQTIQSFDLPSTTTSPCHNVTMSPHHRITTSPCHCVTTSLHHHITASPCHHITMSPHHHMRFSPPHGYESDWLILPNTVLIG